MSPEPPLTCLPDLDAQLARGGFAVLPRDDLLQLCAIDPTTPRAWQGCWDDLPADTYLRDGGRYRRRRHGCFVVTPGVAAPSQRLAAVAHRAHWQPVEYNALHGGLQRWFEPLHGSMVDHPDWAGLLVGLADVAERLVGQPRQAAALAAPGDPVRTRAASVPGPSASRSTWSIEAHPFRIDTADGIGRPTPEGAHRDGVDLVVVILVARSGVKGGETRVFDACGPQGLRFTLDQPWSALLLDDERVIHETTPVQPAAEGVVGHRDTLVLTFRRGGFQGPLGT